MKPQTEADAFNRRHPIGTPVQVFPGARDGRSIETRTRSEAQVLGGHTAVVWVDDYSGCIALSHVKVRAAAAAPKDAA